MKYWLSFLLALPLIMLGLKTTAHADRAVPVVDSLEIGQLNAVKKAHQMTDLPICPVRTLYAHKNKTYQAGVAEKGLIYSSTKEINTSIGQDVSFHTFMTALHNPRSVLYTEKIDQPPYHGKNCRAYYGTVCSGLVTYALGFTITQRSIDIPVADYMEFVEDQSSEGARVGDVVWNKGHVQLVTGIERDKEGQIMRIEICESVNPGCRRVYLDKESFDKILHNNKKPKRLYRYKYLHKNTAYTPINEFVAVDGEKKLPFVYNDDICTSKGDKACFIIGEDVILNLGRGFKTIEIYKDSTYFKTINVRGGVDIAVKGLPYGNYMARAVSSKKKSDFTRWKIIDVNVRIDRDNRRIYFSSSNAVPVYYEFASVSGGRAPNNSNRIYASEFTAEDRKNGYVEVMPPRKPTKKDEGASYVKVHFKCDYGMVINNPINWFK
jgi:hypothetical protein